VPAIMRARKVVVAGDEHQLPPTTFFTAADEYDDTPLGITSNGEMVLAIEADGASYHSSGTVRDRDRLRQEHLERLGWAFHRIWSTDWFTDPAAEVERVRAAYQAAPERSPEVALACRLGSISLKTGIRHQIKNNAGAVMWFLLRS
jgi:hypothetical protein